jgi:hypothetical protein
VRNPQVGGGAVPVGVDEAEVGDLDVGELPVRPQPVHDQAVVVECLAFPDLAEGRGGVVGAHLEVRVHLDRDGVGVAHEPLDVERLAHRAPDPAVVRLHLRDAVQLQGAVQHADVRCHIRLEGSQVLLVEPGDVGVEVCSIHALLPRRGLAI